MPNFDALRAWLEDNLPAQHAEKIARWANKLEGEFTRLEEEFARLETEHAEQAGTVDDARRSLERIKTLMDMLADHRLGIRDLSEVYRAADDVRSP